jgi:hypothetical protein
VKKKIYLIQPTYRNVDGHLLKGTSLFIHSLVLPMLSATIPTDWEKEFEEIPGKVFSPVDVSAEILMKFGLLIIAQPLKRLLVIVVVKVVKEEIYYIVGVILKHMIAVLLVIENCMNNMIHNG